MTDGAIALSLDALLLPAGDGSAERCQMPSLVDQRMQFGT
jgi:hypothetical protein